jgi:hypothetical protein
MPAPISRRVAGIWFIWFLRSFSCVWFDEPESQDRPAYQIDQPMTYLLFRTSGHSLTGRTS